MRSGQHVTTLAQLRLETQPLYSRVAPDNHPQRTSVSPSGIDVEKAAWIQREATHSTFVSAPVRMNSLHQGVEVL